MTVTLRAAVRADQHWLDRWLPAVSQDVGHRPRALEGSERRRIIQRTVGESRGTAAPGREDVGFILYRINTPKRGDVLVELVATPSEHARRGAGMAAAALLEDDLRRRGVHRIFAPASAVHGISMYFWIRLGYQPLLRRDWPCKREGVAWLARDL